MKPPSKKALDLIYKYEVGGGEQYYNKFLKRFTWPAGASGPTIGIGIDCAYYTPKELSSLFSFLPLRQRQLVEAASGKTGQSGREYTKVLRKEGIEVSWTEAQKIFMFTTWPKFAALTDKTFPQADQLCDSAYGALVSLVFNRGGSLSGNSRSEMRAIRGLVPKKNYAAIAKEIRRMKRLWEGKNMEGLLRRRDAEADLVLSCA
jgi:GH24 family phage-related lysozyme (muramidase)